MGVFHEIALLLAVTAAVAQAAALGCALRGRRYLFAVCQFAAGYLLMESACIARWPLLTLAGAALLLPLLFLSGARGAPGLPLLAVLLVASAGLLALSWPDLRSPRLAPVAAAGDVWKVGFPLRFSSGTLVCHTESSVPSSFLERIWDRPWPGCSSREPELLRARLVDWFLETRLSWMGAGKTRQIDVLLGNAGPATDYAVEEGRVEIRAAGGSRMLASCAFPPAGGSCRLRHGPETGPGGVGVIGPTGGDLELLERMVGALRPHRPGVVICLGEQVTAGDYAALLAVRDAIDGLGSRVVFIPGPAESGGWLGEARGALLGPTGRVYNGGGVSTIALDAADGDFSEDRYPLTDPFAVAPSGMVPKILAAFHPILPREAGEEVAGLGSAARAELLGRATAAGAGLAVGATAGAGYIGEAPFGRQLALAHGPAGGEVALVRTTATGFGPIEVIPVPRRSGLRAALHHETARIAAAAAEHPGLGRRLALAVVGLVGALIGLGLRARRGCSLRVRGGEAVGLERDSAGSARESEEITR